MQRSDSSRMIAHGRATRNGWFRRLLGDVLFVARRDRTWWLLPLVAVVLLLAGLMVGTGARSSRSVPLPALLRYIPTPWTVINTSDRLRCVLPRSGSFL